MGNRIIIFDTTLRDGEQAAGTRLGPQEKLKIARQLERLGVDVMEVGFPASSPGDFEAVQAIGKEIHRPIICALTRCRSEDIEIAGKALKGVSKSRIHTGLGVSDIHIESKLRKTRTEVLKMAVQSVKLAREFAREVEFYAEDAGRAEPGFLLEMVEAVIEAGAKIINIPDTTGYTMPEQFASLIMKIREEVPNISQAIISVHCHNDLGLAVANSLAGVKAGARQAECTINGVGERAGNASLEEIVMALKVRSDYFGFSTGIKTVELYRTSKLVSHLLGISVPPNKAIIGKNAFAHSSGIHVDGFLKDRNTYEIMKPEEVGVQQSDVVLTARSGRHALKHRLEKLGYKLKGEKLNQVYERFITVADRKQEVFDEDLEAIVEDEITTTSETYILEYFNTVSGNKTIPTATIRLRKGNAVSQEAACGDGPVDAAYKAIDKITHLKAKLVDYSLQAVTGGKDALGEVHVKVAVGNRTVAGRGASTDIIEASVKAYVNAVNRLLAKRKRT
ncbi:MAG: 2-isopropylmalate synthase [bacterium]